MSLSANSESRLTATRDANVELILALESHPQFAEQRRQNKGKIHFMHDFASRTNSIFNSLIEDVPPPDTPATRGTIPKTLPSRMTNSQRQELETDAFGRCHLLHTLVYDETGMSAMMFGEQPGNGVDLGEAVKTAVNGVNAAAK